MTLDQCVEQLYTTYDVVGQINLNDLESVPIYQQAHWINRKLNDVYQPVYSTNQRIIITLEYSTWDLRINDVLKDLQRQINAVDISNFFVVLVAPDSAEVVESLAWIDSNISQDPVPIRLAAYNAPVKDEPYDYNSPAPLRVKLNTLLDNEKHLLTESKTFCMYPWVHIHAYPTGQAYPCCMSEMAHPIGNTHDNTLEQIWNGPGLRQIRVDMLTETPTPACNNCYEKESAGFFSGRMSANKHHGHHIDKVRTTQEDGTVPEFEMIYWDIRFSNLCNLSCRSCGHIFSSSWYQDQVKLAGPEWKQKNRVLNYAGRTETDMWEQLIPHLDYVEQIYFAGGEPLMMKEHYNILDELERRGRFDVRLIYNTNFTHTRLKDRTVFDYWKRFDSVSVGASLDDMGPRAEYIRKGTDWTVIEANRRQMIETCPDVDFYISPTLSILNADHICEFHRYMVDQGLIKPADLNVNVLQDPPHYRIDIATAEYKQRLRQKFEDHLAWLRPLDPLGRATVGFESSINFLMAQDNSAFLPAFWARTDQLDRIRNEKILDTIPELKELR
jgi:sulfatase maturation enzyme AslB (radical SAM superfamily)